MIFSNIQSQQSKGTVTLAEGDPTGTDMSIGFLAMKREKRDGRNPMTGARTSRRYGLSMIFVTGIEPLTNSDNEPIY